MRRHWGPMDTVCYNYIRFNIHYMRLYLRGSRDALFFHPMTPQKGKPIHYLICVCDCISVVALKIAQTLINKRWIHCNGKIKGDLPWKGQKKEKKLRQTSTMRTGVNYTKGSFFRIITFFSNFRAFSRSVKSQERKMHLNMSLEMYFSLTWFAGEWSKEYIGFILRFLWY